MSVRKVPQFSVTIDNSNRVLSGTMVLNASHRELLENTERFLVGKIFSHPSNQSTSPHPPTHGLHPTPGCVNDASNQYVIMLEPFREQSMLLIDGVEWWGMEV